MNTRFTFLSCAATLLLAACHSLPALPPGTPPRPQNGTEHWVCKPISPEENARLQHAIAHCDSVEQYREWYSPTGGDEREWTCHLYLDGETLPLILARLAAVPQWYHERATKLILIHPAQASRLRFLDDKGRELFKVEGDLVCADTEGKAYPIYNFFPYPTWNCLHGTCNGRESGNNGTPLLHPLPTPPSP